MILVVSGFAKPDKAMSLVWLFHFFPKTKLFFLTLLVVFVLSGCSEPAGYEYLYSGKTMGTHYSVRLLSRSELGSVDEKSLEDGIFSTLNRIDSLMSNYKADSEISGINALKAGESLSLSQETFEVLSESRELWQLSGGLFDISISPLIDLWGFGPAETAGRLPDKADLDSVKARVGMQHVQLDWETMTVTKLVDSELNVSAIAKGYAVDQLVSYLNGKGFSRYLVEVGGEIYARGKKFSGQKWVLGIEAPDFPGRKALETVKLEDQALATSGDYRNYVEKDGVRYSHTIDPLTGSPVLHRLASVSVLSERCSKADGLATALMVMGEEEGIEFARNNALDVLFIIRKDDGFETVSTGLFSSLTK